MISDRLEAYLAEIARRLALLPADERVQQMEEFRQHLEHMALARAEDDLTDHQIEEEIRRQFGDARRVAQELNRTGLRRALRQIPEWADVLIHLLAGAGAVSVLGLLVVTPVIRHLIRPSDSVLELWRFSHVPTARYFWPVLFLNARELPSLVVGLFFCLLICYTDGWRQIIRRWSAAHTVVGAAVQWLFVRQLLGSLTFAALYHETVYRFTFTGWAPQVHIFRPSPVLMADLPIAVPVLAASLWTMRHGNSTALIGILLAVLVGSVESQIPAFLFALRFGDLALFRTPFCVILASIGTATAAAVTAWLLANRRFARA